MDREWSNMYRETDREKSKTGGERIRLAERQTKQKGDQGEQDMQRDM